MSVLNHNKDASGLFSFLKDHPSTDEFMEG